MIGSCVCDLNGGNRVPILSHVTQVMSHKQSFLDGYCSIVQGLLDWFELDLGFTELSFIQIGLCVLQVMSHKQSSTRLDTCDSCEYVSQCFIASCV